MTLRETLARRLEQINRRGVALKTQPSNGSYAAQSLLRAFPGGREWIGLSGNCWVMRHDLVREWPGADALLSRLRPAIDRAPRQSVRGWPESWTGPAIAALDLETCGFASLPVFLAGFVETDGRALVLTQALARDYGEEPALLEWISRRVAMSGGIVTFNGRSFDLPYVRDRLRYHRMQPLDEAPHLDLLHVARRMWRDDVPNCRLQTLELHMAGVARGSDIPGREVPDVYRAFVESGDAGRLRDVVRHNRRDLVTLLELVARAWHELDRDDNGES